MWVFRQLDSVLRGEGTRADQLRDGRLSVSGRAMLVAVVLLGAFYGACMGCYNILTGQPGAWMQIVSSAAKVPLLFLLTLVVTFPSLYVFNALVGSRLTLVNMLRLIMAAIGVMIAVLAGFGTIVAFFNFTTTSYPFILLLNVIVFTVAGVLGLSFLLQTLRRLVEPATKAAPPAEMTTAEAPPTTLEPGALTRVQDGPTDGTVKTIFRIWVIIFALVGAQMSWVMRPFIGSYGDDGFVWFRERGGSFFGRVFEAIVTVLGGGTGSY